MTDRTPTEPVPGDRRDEDAPFPDMTERQDAPGADYPSIEPEDRHQPDNDGETVPNE